MAFTSFSKAAGEHGTWYLLAEAERWSPLKRKQTNKKITSVQQFQHGEGSGKPLQYSCLENPMDGEAWWAAFHGVAKSQTGLSGFTFPFHFHALEKEIAIHSSVHAWRIPGTGSLVGCLLWGRTDLDTTEVTQQQQQQQFQQGRAERWRSPISIPREYPRRPLSLRPTL